MPGPAATERPSGTSRRRLVFDEKRERHVFDHVNGTVCLCLTEDEYDALGDRLDRVGFPEEGTILDELNEFAYDECKRLAALIEGAVDDECLDYYENGTWLKDIYPCPQHLGPRRPARVRLRRVEAVAPASSSAMPTGPPARCGATLHIYGRLGPSCNLALIAAVGPCLRTRDQLESINGIIIHDLESALRAYAQLADAPFLAVRIKRASQWLDFTYTSAP